MEVRKENQELLAAQEAYTSAFNSYYDNRGLDTKARASLVHDKYKLGIQIYSSEEPVEVPADLQSFVTQTFEGAPNRLQSMLCFPDVVFMNFRIVVPRALSSVYHDQTSLPQRDQISPEKGWETDGELQFQLATGKKPVLFVSERINRPVGQSNLNEHKDYPPFVLGELAFLIASASSETSRMIIEEES